MIARERTNPRELTREFIRSRLLSNLDLLRSNCNRNRIDPLALTSGRALDEAIEGDRTGKDFYRTRYVARRSRASRMV